MAKKQLAIPSVLSFEKKLVLSDGYLFGTNWNDAHDNPETPLKIVEKSVRGTISNRFKTTAKNDPAKLNAEVEKANLQLIDACALNNDMDTVKLSFTIKVLGGVDTPYACNNREFAKTYKAAVDSYIKEYGFKELSYRYAYNIACGRFLWRNRVGADRIDVLVNADGDDYKFNAYDYSLDNFDKHDELQSLADKIADVFTGKKARLLIKVDIYANIGAGQEVYPSEELVFNKGKSDKSKVLYEVNNTAAIHSQKLGNALRKIDTWYSAFGTDDGVGPIAIETYGAVTTIGEAFRNPINKEDFYTLFDEFALGNPLNDEKQVHFVMAVILRGGIFGKASDGK